MHESKQGARSRRWLPWVALVGALVVGGVAGGAIVAATKSSASTPASPATPSGSSQVSVCDGLRAEDIITKINGQPATSNVQLQELTLTKKPGDKVPVEYWRNGHTATTTVTLGTQP